MSRLEGEFWAVLALVLARGWRAPAVLGVLGKAWTPGTGRFSLFQSSLREAPVRKSMALVDGEVKDMFCGEGGGGDDEGSWSIFSMLEFGVWAVNLGGGKLLAKKGELD